MCAYHSVQLLYVVQYRAVLIIFPCSPFSHLCLDVTYWSRGDTEERKKNRPQLGVMLLVM